MPGPANDYWDHADYVIDLAARHGMYVAIVAAWSNSLETDEHPMVRDPEVAYAYGHFLGDRYRNRTHIIWLMGGDAFGRPDRGTLSAERRRMTRALAEGIADGLRVHDYEPAILPLPSDVRGITDMISKANVDVLFNLMETAGGESPFEPYAVGIFELMGIPYTGATPETLTL